MLYIGSLLVIVLVGIGWLLFMLVTDLFEHPMGIAAALAGPFVVLVIFFLLRGVEELRRKRR